MKLSVLYGTVIALLLAIGSNAWAQQATTASGRLNVPNADKAPMDAQELAKLVPKDSSQPQTPDISSANANNDYRYDQQGVNCSLYPARCRGEDY